MRWMEAQDTSFSWWWPVRGSGDAGSGRNAVAELAHRPGLRTGEQVVEHPRDLGLVGVVQAFLGGQGAGVAPGELRERRRHHRQVRPGHGDPSIRAATHSEPSNG
jgi:hypothetical protein